MPNAPLNTPHGSISLTYQSSSPVKRNKEFALTWLLDLSSATPANNGVHPCPDGQFHHIKVLKSTWEKGTDCESIGNRWGLGILPAPQPGWVCFQRPGLLFPLWGDKEGGECFHATVHTRSERRQEVPLLQREVVRPSSSSEFLSCSPETSLGYYLPPAWLLAPCRPVSTSHPNLHWSICSQAVWIGFMNLCWKRSHHSNRIKHSNQVKDKNLWSL